ncbi:MAG: XTP/dITP diphosphatase [Thaumarchaeota archaeon]|nr:XTP/dITP diphosphatase [Nitrososphaerota archaeon]
MKLYFATGNPRKFAEVKQVLEEFGIELEQINIKGEEVQANNVLAVVENAANKIAKEFSKPFIVEDASLQIEVLNTFPGPYSSYVYKTIGLGGVLKLLEEVDHRYAEFHSAISYGEKGKVLKNVIGIAEGSISRKIRGVQGFGFDPIFIPQGSRKTFGEMTMVEKNRFSHRAKAARIVGEWLSSKVSV